MTVPCTCRIPDPVVVNGQCLVCYGDRLTVEDPGVDINDRLLSPEDEAAHREVVSQHFPLSDWQPKR